MMVDADDLYRRAMASGTSLSGYYNRNVPVVTDKGAVVVRIPIAGADGMDLRIWREHEVLRSLAPHIDAVPEVLHVNDEPRFQIHRFIDGEVVDRLAPRGVAVPVHLPGDVVRFLNQLGEVPCTVLPTLPEDWPADGDCAAFAHRLSATTQGVWDAFSGEYAPIYRALGFPADPLADVRGSWASLAPRPFAALHCDIHRKNLITRSGRTWFLDWELALWGDPLYDLAVHMHKMGYLHHEAAAVTELWFKTMPASVTVRAQEDLDTYLRHERVKSAIVDTVRYAKQVRDGASAADARALGESLAAKLALARRVWGLTGELDVGEVLEALRQPVTIRRPRA